LTVFPAKKIKGRVKLSSVNILTLYLIRPQRRQLGFLEVASAKLDSLFWNKFEETLFRWLI
jgi:hypothetical protein